MRYGWLLTLAIAGCGRLSFDETSSAIDAALSGPPTFVQASAPALISGASTATISLPQRPAAHSAVVVSAWNFVMGGAGGFAAATDDAANTYQVESAVDSGCTSSGSSGVAIFIALDVVSPATNLVVTISGLDTTHYQEIGVVVAEYTGIRGIDRKASHVSASGPTPIAFDSGTTATTTFAPEIATAVGTTCAGPPGIVTWTDTASFTVMGSATATAMTQPGIATYREIASPSQVVDSWKVGFTGSPGTANIGAVTTFY